MGKEKLKCSDGNTYTYDSDVAKRVLVKNRKDLLRKPPATSLVYEKCADEKAVKAAKEKE